jgi:hypothetical protein
VVSGKEKKTCLLYTKGRFSPLYFLTANAAGVNFLRGRIVGGYKR